MKLLALTLAAVILGTLAYADDNDGEPVKAEDKAERELQVQVQSNQVQIQSETKQGDNKNKFELHWQVNDNRLSVEMRTYSKSTDSQAKARFKWKIGRVVEYNDSNSVPGYQVGDTVGAMWDFSRSVLDFSSLPATTNSQGQTVEHFQGLSRDGFFKIVGHVSGGDYSAQTNTFTPTAHKFDIILNPSAAGAFNYQLVNGRVAIVGWVMSKLQTKQRNTDGSETTQDTFTAKRVRFGADASPAGFFSWDLNPNCTNAGGATASCPIISSPLVDDPAESNEGDSGNINKRTSHSFDIVRPRLIEWDPLIGMGGAGAHVVPSISLLAALVLYLFYALA